MDETVIKWETPVIDILIKFMWISLFFPWFHKISTTQGLVIIHGFQYLLENPIVLASFLALMVVHSIVLKASGKFLLLGKRILIAVLLLLVLEPFYKYGMVVFSFVEYGYIVFLILLTALFMVVVIPLGIIHGKRTIHRMKLIHEHNKQV